jgi:hypothetical protein
VLQNLGVNRVLGGLVNAVRSTPFIILLVAVIPFTRLVVGSSIGTAAAVVPLTLAAAPFIARLVETALREVDRGLIEAAQSMGATTSQIVFKVLLPEALPGIVAGLTITFVSLVGYSAMAGAIGGGGARRPRDPLRLPALSAGSDVDGGRDPDRVRADRAIVRRLARTPAEPQKDLHPSGRRCNDASCSSSRPPLARLHCSRARMRRPKRSRSA